MVRGFDRQVCSFSSLLRWCRVSDNHRQPSLIPCGADIEELQLEDDIGWVLIVEKEVRRVTDTIQRTH